MRVSVSSKKGEHRNFDDLHDALAGAILKMRLLDWLDFVILDVDDPVKKCTVNSAASTPAGNSRNSPSTIRVFAHERSSRIALASISSIIRLGAEHVICKHLLIRLVAFFLINDVKICSQNFLTSIFC